MSLPLKNSMVLTIEHMHSAIIWKHYNNRNQPSTPWTHKSTRKSDENVFHLQENTCGTFSELLLHSREHKMVKSEYTSSPDSSKGIGGDEA